MPRILSKDKVATLARLSKSGDMLAQALVQMCQEVSLVPGSVSGGISHVKAQIVDGLGAPVNKIQNVLLTVSANGTCAMTITAGTVESGNGTDAVWLQTTSSGTFAFDIEDGLTPDLCLIKAETSDGIRAIVPVQF